jgi:hypothetical protein
VHRIAAIRVDSVVSALHVGFLGAIMEILQLRGKRYPAVQVFDIHRGFPISSAPTSRGNDVCFFPTLIPLLRISSIIAIYGGEDELLAVIKGE